MFWQWPKVTEGKFDVINTLSMQTRRFVYKKVRKTKRLYMGILEYLFVYKKVRKTKRLYMGIMEFESYVAL